jgi:hypothetical protein
MNSVYHYTTLDAAISILGKDKKPYLCFWGTRYDSMDDPYDYLYAKDIIIPGLTEFLKGSNVIPKENKEYVAMFPYIVSFSKKEDDFFMWRTYHADIALEIDYEVLKSSCFIKNDKEEVIQRFHIDECTYVNDDNIHEKFIEKLNNAKQSDKILDDVQEQAVLMKHENFVNENEVRLFAPDYDLFYAYYDATKEDKCAIIDHEMPQDIGFKYIKNGDIVLYKKFYIPKEALKGIILSDIAHFGSLKIHLELWLLNQGYNVNKINIRCTNHKNFVK